MLGLMNARSVANKLDYVFDHIINNNLDIVALTETWLSNEEVNNRRVVMEFVLFCKFILPGCGVLDQI